VSDEHTFFWVCATWSVPTCMFWAGGAWADVGLWVVIALVVFWVAHFARP
jgi:hypothetical protein